MVQRGSTGKLGGDRNLATSRFKAQNLLNDIVLRKDCNEHFGQVTERVRNSRVDVRVSKDRPGPDWLDQSGRDRDLAEGATPKCQ